MPFSRNVIFVLPLCLAFSLLARPGKRIPEPGKQSAKTIKKVAAGLFEFGKGATFKYMSLDDIGEFGEKFPDGSYRFYGKLLDTGAINMLYLYKYTGKTVRTIRVYLTKRALVDYTAEWVRIRGKLTGPGRWEKLELEPISFEIQNDREQKLESPRNLVCMQTRFYRKGFDLNPYKRSGEMDNDWLKKVRKKNLNKLPFRKRNNIIFYDHHAEKMGVDCGHVVLFEGGQFGFFLTYLAIYDFKLGQLTRVRVVRDGYLDI